MATSTVRADEGGAPPQAGRTAAHGVPIRPRDSIGRRFFGAISLAWESVFGSFCLLVGLAILATLPVLQLLSLGYLLEVSGRIARTGRCRAGLFGARQAARVGTIVLGMWLWSLPLVLAQSVRDSAWLIDAESRAAGVWTLISALVAVLVTWQIAAACARGGRLRHFFWPRPLAFARRLFTAGTFGQLRDATWECVSGLRLPYYFALGLKGFAGALVWLALPVSLLALGRSVPPAGLLGGLLLALVVLYLPLLQTRLAAEGRFACMFRLGEIRRVYRAAPLALAAAVGLTLLLALPLYVLKVELIPREAAWLPSILFVISIYPARLAAGWAWARAVRHGRPRHALFRFAGRLATLVLAAAYVVIVYFTQYVSWYGVWSLYEQHAFLVPAPFLGM